MRDLNKLKEREPDGGLAELIQCYEDYDNDNPELLCLLLELRRRREDAPALIDRLEAAEARVKELEANIQSLDGKMWQLEKIGLEHKERAEAAKAELSRRDKEAGEPVGVRKVFTCSGCGADGLDEPIESSCHCYIDGANWVEGKLYTAAQPAALPPEIINADAPDHYSSDETYAWVAGANWMREQAKALGVKPLRVTLPKSVGYSKSNSAEIIFLSKDAVIASLNAQGIEVEE